MKKTKDISVAVKRMDIRKATLSATIRLLEKRLAAMKERLEEMNRGSNAD